MTDFFQNGVIATLQRLGRRPLEAIEDELVEHSRRQKVVLILPALYSEFEGPAMPGIVEELKGARYLDRIVLSLDQADRSQFERVRGIMGELPMNVSILWNDGPRIQELLAALDQEDFSAEQGKGRGVWLAMGYALTFKDANTIALHDCDIVNYEREMLSRLVYPVVHPGTDFEFSKGYYARVNDKLHGRVTRLFVTPLVRALRSIYRDVLFFEFLDSFRYPLAGEFAFIRSLAKGVRISPNWGLEVSMLGEVFENTTVQRVCQVEIADRYEHKHQQLTKDTESGLGGMATDIATTLFSIMGEGGVLLSRAFFDTLKASYMRYSRRAIEQYNALAMLNGIRYDRHAEIEAVEIYADALKAAEKRYMEDPVSAPMMSAWVRVRAALPHIGKQLREAVKADNS